MFQNYCAFPSREFLQKKVDFEGFLSNLFELMGLVLLYFTIVLLNDFFSYYFFEFKFRIWHAECRGRKSVQLKVTKNQRLENYDEVLNKQYLFVSLLFSLSHHFSGNINSLVRIRYVWLGTIISRQDRMWGYLGENLPSTGSWSRTTSCKLLALADLFNSTKICNFMT